MNFMQLVMPFVTVLRVIDSCLNIGSLNEKQAIVCTFYVSAHSRVGEKLIEYHITAHLLLLRAAQVVNGQSLNLPLTLCATESGPGCWASISRWKIIHRYTTQPYTDWKSSVAEWMERLIAAAEGRMGGEARKSQFVFAPHGMPRMILLKEYRLEGEACEVLFPLVTPSFSSRG